MGNPSTLPADFFERSANPAVLPADFDFDASPKSAASQPIPGMERLGGTPPGIPLQRSLPPEPRAEAFRATQPGLLDRAASAFREGAIGHALGMDTGRFDAPDYNQERPLLKVSEMAPEEGVGRGVAKFAEGMTTAPNLLMMAGTGGLGALPGAAGKAVPRVVSGLFSADMLKGIADQSPELYQAIQSGDYGRAKTLATELGLQGVLAILAGKHAVAKPKIAVPAAMERAKIEAPPEPAPTPPEGPRSIFVPQFRKQTAEIATRPAGQEPIPLNQARKRAMVQPPEEGEFIDPEWDRTATQLGFRSYEAAAPEDQAIIRQMAEEKLKPPKRQLAVPQARGPATRTEQTAPQAPPDLRLGPGSPTEADQILERLTRPEQQQPDLSSTLGKLERERLNRWFEEHPNEERPESLQSVNEGNAPDEQHVADRQEQDRAPSELDRRGTREGGPVQEPRRPNAPVAPGAETTVRVPGEGTVYPSRYVVRELDDVHASHNPFTFESNPDYFHKNERNYSDAANQERVVENSTPARFDPAYLINDNPTATNGPAVIDPDGNALGGNNRMMILERVYQSHPEGAEAYKSLLARKAGQFGIDPNQVLGMKKPVLVRELDPEQIRSTSRAITDFNKKETAELTPSEKATSDARILNPDALDYLNSIIEDAGPDATLNDALTGPKGAQIVNKLVDAGVFTMQEKPNLVDPKTGALTAGAKERIGKMMLGRLFRDSEQYQRTPPELRNKLERIVGPVAQLQGKGGWDITPAVQEAMDLSEYARAHDIKNLDGVLSQDDLFGAAPEWSPEAVAIAKTLQRKPTAVTRAFRQYAQEGAYANNPTQSMFGAPSPEESFANAFGADNPERGSFRISGEDAAAIRAKAQSAKQKLDDFWLGVRRQLTDDKAALERMAQVSHVPAARQAAHSAYDAARNFAGWRGKAAQQIEFELGPIVEKAFDLGMSDVDKYAKLERELEIGSPDRENPITKFEGGRTLEDITAEKAALEAKLGPEKVAQVQQVLGDAYKLMRGTLKEALDAGLISSESYRAMAASGEKYVPLDRLEYVAENLQQVANGRRAFSVARQNLYHSMTGSEKATRNLFQSIASKLIKSKNTIERNIVARRVADLSQHFPDDIFEVNGEEKLPPDTGTFNVLIDGQKRQFAAPKPVADVMTAATKAQATIFHRMARFSASILREGATTLNPAFTATNALRDYQSALKKSAVGMNPLMWAEGFMHAVRKDGVFQDYLKSGASFSGYFEGQKNLEPLVKQIGLPSVRAMLRHGEYKMAAGKVVSSPVDLIKAVNEKIEQAPRIGVFQKSIERGYTPEQASLNSRNATVDFAKAGTAMREVNQVIPFLNARTQGTINNFLAYKENWKRAVLVDAAFATAAASLYLANQYRFPQIQRDLSEFEKNANLFLIYGNGKDDQGRWDDLVKVPKGDGMQMIANPIENVFDWYYKNNPKSARQLALTVASDLSPIRFERYGEVSAPQIMSSVLPPALKAVVEGATNHNLFRDRPIVPDRYAGVEMKKLPPEERYTARTAKWAIPAARAIHRVTGEGISPMILENTAETQLGGIGRIGNVASQDPTLKSAVLAIPQAIASRFKGAYGGELDRQAVQQLHNVQQKHETEKIDDLRSAQEFDRTVRTMPEEQRAAALNAFLRNPDGSVNQGHLKALKRVALTPSQPAAKSDIELKRATSIERAEFMHQQLESSPDQAGTLLRHWKEQKLLSPTVLHHLKELAIQQ